VTTVDFGTRAPQGVDPKDYALAGGVSPDGFGWPAVIEDRNIIGPYSAAVPTVVAGMGLAHRTFGTKPWADLLGPAVELARAGMMIDWYATLQLAAEAREMAPHADLAAIYLPDGRVPSQGWGGPPPRLNLDPLAATIQRIAEQGPEDFYTGTIADSIDADCRRAGSPLRKADLAAFRPVLREPAIGTYRGARVHTAPGMSAGPTLLDALSRLERANLGKVPDAAAYLAYAEALYAAYKVRLATLGDTAHAPSSTTTYSVVDGHGNMAIVTQTLMSGFGSKVRLPGTGVILNNGMMWFDPVPGSPNCIVPGKRPLSNMAPTVVLREDAADFGLGALGGRRIFPAVFQLLSFIHDFGMDLEAAFHQPRIDVSGGPDVTVDPRLRGPVLDALAARHPVVVEMNGVMPIAYAEPNGVMQAKDGRQWGAIHVPAPWSKALAA